MQRLALSNFEKIFKRVVLPTSIKILTTSC